MSNRIVKVDRNSERGGAGVKFLLVLMVLALSANAAFNYIPVAYQGENYKQEMQTIVVQAMAVPANGANPTELMRQKLLRAASDFGLPPVVIEVQQNNKSPRAHVVYSKEVSILPFGIYNYDYEFDHTATPAGFLMKSD